MVVCTICNELIPRAKKCAHGKKPVNCGGACLTAYVEEHIATCQGKKVTNYKGKAKISEEEAFRVKSVKDGEDNSGKADDGFTATVDVSEKNHGAEKIDRRTLLTFMRASSRKLCLLP
jgi:hypothetical protein